MSEQKTHPSASDEEKPSIRLGSTIKRLRKANGWKLETLSKRSGIALSSLSKVENGILSLTYDRMLQVAAGFEISLPELLAEVDSQQRAAARVSWATKHSGDTIDSHAYTYRYLATDLRTKAMVPIVSEVKCRSLEEFGPLLEHHGEEFVCVLEGEIEVHTAYYEPRRLSRGEGVYIDSRMGHAYLKASNNRAVILSVNSGI